MGDKSNTVENINRVQESNKMKALKAACIVCLLFFIGFNCGQFYETINRNTVYILNEAKFFKLVSMGIATEDKGDIKPLSEDKAKVKAAMEELSLVLSRSYSKYPIIIQRKTGQGYELYNDTKKVDITKDVIIKLIGIDKWEDIGKALKQ